MTEARAPDTAAERFLCECLQRLKVTLAQHGFDRAQLESRVKTQAAIEQKRLRRPNGRINDLIGIRVVVDHVGLLSAVTKVIEGWDGPAGLRLVATDDYFLHPGVGGYRAKHFDFEIVDFSAVGLTSEAGVEVQVTTAILAVISRVSHSLLYGRGSPAAPAAADELAELQADALSLDERLATLATIGADG